VGGQSSGCFSEDKVRNDFGIGQDLSVPEPQHTIAARFKECRPFRIIPHAIILAVLRAIQFNDDLRTVTCEVRNIVANRGLPSKMHVYPFEFT